MIALLLTALIALSASVLASALPFFSLNTPKHTSLDSTFVFAALDISDIVYAAFDSTYISDLEYIAGESLWADAPHPRTEDAPGSISCGAPFSAPESRRGFDTIAAALEAQARKGEELELAEGVCLRIWNKTAQSVVCGTGPGVLTVRYSEALRLYDGVARACYSDGGDTGGRSSIGAEGGVFVTISAPFEP